MFQSLLSNATCTATRWGERFAADEDDDSEEEEEEEEVPTRFLSAAERARSTRGVSMERESISKGGTRLALVR